MAVFESEVIETEFIGSVVVEVPIVMNDGALVLENLLISVLDGGTRIDDTVDGGLRVDDTITRDGGSRLDVI